MREIAARCLARFSSLDAVAALERLLKREKVREVRVSAVHGLLELYEAGQDPRLGASSKCFSTQGRFQDPHGEHGASAPASPGRAAGLLRRLRLDAIEEIARRAAEITEEDEAPAPRDKSRVEPSCASLRPRTTKSGTTRSTGWPRRTDRVRGDRGRDAPSRGRSEYCTRAGMALKALGPRRVRGLAEALDVVDEPLPLQVLVEVAAPLATSRSSIA